MVSRAVLDVMGALAALVVTGCFDVHSVDPGPLVIDDFEDGDWIPSDPRFEQWGCQKFPGPADQKYDCTTVRPGYLQSDQALYLEATIEAPPNSGIQQHGGASLYSVSSVTVDFSGFRQLVFAAKLESGSPPLPSTPTLDVQLACLTAHPIDKSDASSIFVSSGPLSVGSDWSVWRVALADFSLPTTMTPIEGGARACLQVVDTVRFAVDAHLGDGQSGQFVLHIDDVELE